MRSHGGEEKSQDCFDEKGGKIPLLLQRSSQSDFPTCCGPAAFQEVTGWASTPALPQVPSAAHGAAASAGLASFPPCLALTAASGSTGLWPEDSLPGAPSLPRRSALIGKGPSESLNKTLLILFCSEPCSLCSCSYLQSSPVRLGPEREEDWLAWEKERDGF